MTKRTRNILLGIVLFLIIVNTVSYIMRRNSDNGDGNLAGRISRSETSVKINGTRIPAYSFKKMVYIAAQDLQLFHFSVEENDIERVCNITNPDKDYTLNEDYMSSLSYIKENKGVSHQNYKTYFEGKEVSGYKVDKYIIIPVNVLEIVGKRHSESASVLEYTMGESGNAEAPNAAAQDVSVAPPSIQGQNSKIIVLDPGHGASSDTMSVDARSAAGWVYNADRDQWGEWRHWKSGTVWEDCNGSGCNGRAPKGGGCWYPIGNGDRDTEPDINLQNCLAAKRYLEGMGYTVRLTRSSNAENPSITERIKNCYPDKNTSAAPDAMAYVCVHSNAGGGNGSAYISLGGSYDQAGIPSNYVDAGNALGKAMNDRIVAQTSLGDYADGCLTGLQELILFCKSPVICSYLEIGFFDNSSDLEILKTESDAIGKAIAEGIHEYFGNL